MIKKKLVFMSSLSKKIYISMNHVNFLSFDNDDMKPSKRQVTASFPVVLGDFGCDVTCQACRESSPRTPSRYRARFQASSGHSHSANRPRYEAGQVTFLSLISGLITTSINKILQNLVSPSPYENPLRGQWKGEDASGPSLILLNYL